MLEIGKLLHCFFLILSRLGNIADIRQCGDVIILLELWSALARNYKVCYYLIKELISTQENNKKRLETKRNTTIRIEGYK